MNDLSDTVLHGDCLAMLPTIATGSVNFVLTDPPYITRYRSRDGRHVPKHGRTAG